MGYRQDFLDNHKPKGGWHRCADCGKGFRAKDIDVDHIIPQKFGGSGALWNLQPMCRHDNRSKGASLSNTVPDLVKNLFRK